MQDIFIITVENQKTGDSKISNEAYRTRAEANEFIKSRSDKPVQVFNFLWIGTENNYLIDIVQVKEGEPDAD